MTQKHIEVVVQADGSIKIEAMGFVGPDCEKATAFLEEALGSVKAGGRKSDYYVCTTVKTQQKVGV